MLTKERIRELLRKLNEKCKAKNVSGEIGIVGGAVMCLVFNARPSTKDIDGIFAPTDQLREMITEISEEEGVPEDWLNDGAKGYLSDGFERVEVMTLSNLRVWAPSPEYMLAMKCVSARFDTKDADDVIFLMRYLALKTVDSVLDVVERYYPRSRVPPKTHLFLGELVETSFS